MKQVKYVDRRTLGWLIAGICLIDALPAASQQTNGGSVATSTAGRTGERQTRDDNSTNIEPTARINNRIQNRIQSRLRTRIDRDYNPDAVFLSPYESAADGARNAGRARRR